MRTSLRNELLLGELPQSAYVSLRISAEGETVSGSARVWRETIESTRRSVAEDLEQVDAANLNRYLDVPGPGEDGGQRIVAQRGRGVEHPAG